MAITLRMTYPWRASDRVLSLRSMGSPWQTSLRPFVLGTALAFGTGCGASTGPPATTAPVATQATAEPSAAAPAELPAILEALGPSSAQRVELLALRDRLTPELESLQDAGLELALTVAKAARRCDGNLVALEGAASWAVAAGEQARGTVLDAIDELHRILSPAQRKALADRLLGKEKESKTESSTDSGARSLGDALDLSVGQMLTILVRAQALASALEERIEPWRPRLKKTLEAFADEHFAIREHEIAEVPVVALATDFLRDALRTLLPILEREQCEALAGLIQEAVDKGSASPDRSGPR